MMRRIGIWRTIAGLGFATSIGLGALALLQSAFLIALLGVAIAMVLTAERIHQLERRTLGDAERGRVRTCKNWTHWRQPEVVAATAGTALVTIGLAPGPGAIERIVLIAIFVAGAIVMRPCARTCMGQEADRNGPRSAGGTATDAKCGSSSQNAGVPGSL